MKNSSAATQARQNDDSLSIGRGTYNGSYYSSSLEFQNTSSEFSNLPSFDAKSYAATSKIAARVHSANVSHLELKSLLRERRLLLDKKNSGESTQEDNNRLAYVRWSLDRIEDAKYGQGLDILEEKLNAYERLLNEIEVLTKELHSKQRGRRK